MFFRKPPKCKKPGNNHNAVFIFFHCTKCPYRKTYAYPVYEKGKPRTIHNGRIKCGKYCGYHCHRVA